MKENNYVFNELDDLVNYLYSKFDELSPIKLQKGLYFLYAYYGATYGAIDKIGEGEIESDKKYPSKLFNANFEAWRYGPVIREVWTKRKSGYYTKCESVRISEVDNDILLFIDDLFEQINSVNDFSLVDRSHQDKAWKNIYNEETNNIIDNDKLIQEYIERYV